MSINKPQITKLNYVVTILFGVAFTIVLLFVPWNNSIDSKAREFELASSSIKDTVARNVQTANDSLNSLSSFIEVNPNLSEEQYSSISASLLDLHPFIDGTVYVTRKSVVTETTRPFEILFQSFRNSRNSEYAQELLNSDAYTNAVDILFDSGSSINMASNYTSNGWKAYWILHGINPQSYQNQSQGEFGFVAILVNTDKLVGANINNSELSIMLLSESAGLSGRQTLYQDNKMTDAAWFARSFVEEGITQFPLYSVKLSIMKNLSWKELDKTMLFISLLIGVGVTLLLTALMKSKDEQQQELSERNYIIEAQVLVQTDELAKARDEALEASLMKSSFLASMSHEIRTPLNAIIGMSDLLSETELNFEQKKYVAVFKRAGDTLLSLVNDILDLSKIEANQFNLEIIEYNLIETVEESVEIYALKAAEKSIELITDIQVDIFPVRLGDPTRLRQILLNLISNALKFTTEGEIIVSINSETEESGQSLEIAVSDTGTGIPEDKLEKIFESFSQADSSTTRKFGGTGLGLTISRHLVEMMNGSISVESELGKGSKFTVRVNMPIVDGHKDNVIRKADPDAYSVLIVDDNQYYREVLSSYLFVTGANITSVKSADLAFEFINNNGNNQDKVQLLLVDAEMPDRDGFSLIKQLKDAGYIFPTIMMLNPSTLNDSQKYLNEFGIQQMYLTKPIKMMELQNMVVNTLLGSSSKNKGIVLDSDEEKVRSLRILLVDDNPDNRLLVNAYLKKLPYELDEAENGEEAVTMFIEGSYDVVLMDVQMPVMDGREATRRIRAWEQKNGKTSVQIIALTAHAIKEEIELCMEAGCNAHLSKPVKKHVLIKTIQTATS
jgi:signal transduction histidine kinase/CheY-like chemotaxis protein